MEAESEIKDNLVKLDFLIYIINFYKTIHRNRNLSVNNENSSYFHQRIHSCIEGYMDCHSWNLLLFIVVYIFYIRIICLLYCKMTQGSGTVPSQPHVIWDERAHFCPGAGHTSLASLDTSLTFSLQSCDISTLEKVLRMRQLGEHFVSPFLATTTINLLMTSLHLAVTSLQQLSIW